jgi:prepilin-type processing-associated H-X9-DG protein
MFTYSKAAIKPSDPQIDPTVAATNHLHDGKFNYLMVDAHVDILRPGAKPGIWIINQQH